MARAGSSRAPGAHARDKRDKNAFQGVCKEAMPTDSRLPTCFFNGKPAFRTHCPTQWPSHRRLILLLFAARGSVSSAVECPKHGRRPIFGDLSDVNFPRRKKRALIFGVGMSEANASFLIFPSLLCQLLNGMQCYGRRTLKVFSGGLKIDRIALIPWVSASVR